MNAAEATNYNPSARDAGRRAGHEVNIGGNRAIGAGAKALKS